MNQLLLNGTFLLRLSPYLAVGIVLLLAILVVFRQWIPGIKQSRTGCCDVADDHDQASPNSNKSKDHAAPVKALQDLPLCGSCKGCRIMACPGHPGQAGHHGQSAQAVQTGYPVESGVSPIQKGT